MSSRVHSRRGAFKRRRWSTWRIYSNGCRCKISISFELINKQSITVQFHIQVISTLALMTKNDSVPGVSVDIHVSYLKSAKEGDVVLIEADTIKTGRNLAFLECVLKHKKDGSIIAKGAHTKYVG